jgi:hypothetical protein
MAKTPEPYLDPVSEGICEAQGCSNPAKHRASWAQGIFIRLVCSAHKADVEGKPFEELGASVLGGKRHTK